MAKQSRRRAPKEEEEVSEEVEEVEDEEETGDAPKSLYEWSAADVGEWLDTALAGEEDCELSQATHLLRESISLSKKDRIRYVAQLELHQITGAVVAQGLSVKDLNAIGVQKVGHVRLIYALLIELTQIDFTQASTAGVALEEIDAFTNIPRLLLEQFTPIPEGTLNSLKLLGAKRIKESEKVEKKPPPVAPPAPAVSQPKLGGVPGNGQQGPREAAARLQPAALHLEAHVHAKANNVGGAVQEPPVVSLAKLIAAGAYLFFATFCTAFTMILVHDRVPDQGKWPPLPDIVLDNVPLIPWAFAVSECILLVLVIILTILLLLHRHRMIVLKRIMVIVATAFVMRCVTMYVTSLAVPGDHLECDALHLGPSVEAKLRRAWEITSGMGMSISGVRTCGDYMFSGHTVMLTVLNYSIVEYGANFIDELRIVSWVLNMFGMFFVLAGHEHYTLDVIVAYYVASRMFLYYHDAAETDTKNSRGLFPMFNYFEEYSGGQKLPNKYEAPWRPLMRLAKDFKTLYRAMPAKQARPQEANGAGKANEA